VTAQSEEQGPHSTMLHARLAGVRPISWTSP
jgi:hypothetical protein